MVKTCGLNNYSNVHYTNDDTVKKIVDFFQPVGRCLEPCSGNGAFLKHMPQDTDWCELQKGRDFFDYSNVVDWIVTNPPFEELTLWMEKAFGVAENVVFLIPLSKLDNMVALKRSYI